ncbi:hypothetical protein AVEN_63160-1 [Araneus ventricosus]|uniref:Uncharacterized protein n=1 Tax=Araneus ventricosus TaxID=182803 RepID=A0A4Y2B1W5_ARAVE|nr:hypothetical protein AVEN_63160-1 [Araneus ventricosus]
MTPGMAAPLQASAPHQRWGDWPLRMIRRAAGLIHGGSKVESGFESGALRPKGQAFALGHHGPSKICNISSYVCHVTDIT